MKSRYDNSPGKDASMAKTRQMRYESEHAAKNQFVKAEQAKAAKNQGRVPNLNGEAMMTNAYMCNNGEHAQEFARELTRSLEPEFPVR